MNTKKILLYFLSLQEENNDKVDQKSNKDKNNKNKKKKKKKKRNKQTIENKDQLENGEKTNGNLTEEMEDVEVE